MKVLLVEDDIISRTMLEAMLIKSGCEVVTASNGMKAPALFEVKQTPDLRLIDWTMPEMNGIELRRKIRQMELKIPPYIILVTAKVKSSDVVIGLDAGADDYITKPTGPDELHARLRAGKRIRRLQSTLTNRVEELEEAYGRKRYT